MLHVASKLVFGCSALAMAATPIALPRGDFLSDPAGTLPPVPTVIIATGAIDYPEPGEFLRDNYPADPPRVRASLARPVEIATYQVTTADYARCVEDGECRRPRSASPGRREMPVTGVSYDDATAYAAWYSRKTGAAWRLPTDLEWAVAAAERFREGSVRIERDARNPAKAWLQRYAFEASDPSGIDGRPQPAGAFGANSRGIYDLSGSVWEWTSSCYTRSMIAKDGRVEVGTDYCGVHVVEGRHRTYMSNFIRDPKGGGCAVGTPPDNLGFRLVRDRSLKARLMLMLEGLRRRIG